MERRWLRHTQKGVKKQCGAGSCDRFTARPSVSANLIAYGDRRIPAFASLTTPRLILAYAAFRIIATRTSPPRLVFAHVAFYQLRPPSLTWCIDKKERRVGKYSSCRCCDSSYRHMSIFFLSAHAARHLRSKSSETIFANQLRRHERILNWRRTGYGERGKLRLLPLQSTYWRNPIPEYQNKEDQYIREKP